MKKRTQAALGLVLVLILIIASACQAPPQTGPTQVEIVSWPAVGSPVTEPVPAEESRSAGNVTTLRSLRVQSDTGIGRDLTVGNDATVSGDAAVSGDVVVDGTLTVTGGVTGANVLTTGNQTVGGIKTLTTSLGFEGATANEFEVYLASADATADVTATLPIASGTIMLSSLATNAPAAANSVTGGSNALIFEGSAADANETTVSATNPTAARSVVLADASGTVMLSTLATNAPEVANSITGKSNGLVFEGATGGDGFQTILVPVDTTSADKTITLPNVTGTAHVDEATQPLIASTGTFATDVTLTPAAANGNGGLKSELSGLPRIKFAGVGGGTNAALSVVYLDDTPGNDCAPVGAAVSEAESASIFKFGTLSYASTFTDAAVADNGFLCTIASTDFETVENAGMWVYPTVTVASGDLQLVVTDDPTGAVKFSLGAMTANTWNWVEVNISALNAGTGDAVTGLGITLTAQGEAAAGTTGGAWTLYTDRFVKWLSVDSDTLAVDVLQDGVLSVANTTAGITLAEWTDYFVRYISGNDAIVYMTNQSAATSVVALVAY